MAKRKTLKDSSGNVVYPTTKAGVVYMPDNTTTVDQALNTVVNSVNALGTSKQDKLTAGTNITIDANNVISAAGGSSVNVVQTTGTSTADVMSQNAVTTELNGKQGTLTAGDGISIANNVISAINCVKELDADTQYEYNLWEMDPGAYIVVSKNGAESAITFHAESTDPSISLTLQANYGNFLILGKPLYGNQWGATAYFSDNSARWYVAWLQGLKNGTVGHIRLISPDRETWTFTLSDDTTVTKKVAIYN